MAQKKLVMGVSAFLLVAVLFIGWFALAAELGGKEDPLVTLSYLKSLDPKIEELISKAVREEADRYINEQNERLTQAVSQLEEWQSGAGAPDIAALLADSAFMDSLTSQVAGKIGASGGTGAVSDTFKKVVLENGKTVYLAMGTMILLRTGSAVCVATDTPGLIDLTDGDKIDNNGKLLQNHLYTMTVESVNLDGTSPYRGFKATANNTTVFILGKYNIK